MTPTRLCENNIMVVMLTMNRFYSQRDLNNYRIMKHDSALLKLVNGIKM